MTPDARPPDYNDPAVPGAAPDEARERPPHAKKPSDDEVARQTDETTDEVHEGNTLVDPSPGD